MSQQALQDLEFDFTPKPKTKIVSAVEDGAYLAKFIEYTEPKEEENKYKPGETRLVSIFRFEIIQGPAKGTVLSDWVNVGADASFEKSKIYKVVTALSAGQPPEGRLKLRPLIGKACRIMVSSEYDPETAEPVKSRIVEYKTVGQRQTPAPAPVQKRQVQQQDEEIEDLPL
jgi:hypothetical protein